MLKIIKPFGNGGIDNELQNKSVFYLLDNRVDCNIGLHSDLFCKLLYS